MILTIYIIGCILSFIMWGAISRLVMDERRPGVSLYATLLILSLFSWFMFLFGVACYAAIIDDEDFDE